MDIRLEVIDGPDLEALKNLTFCTEWPIPPERTLTFKVRGLRKEEADRYRENQCFPFKTWAENGDGFCLINITQILKLEPSPDRSKEIWNPKGFGTVTGGEGAAYAAWMSEEYEHLRKHMARYGGLQFTWNDYSTKTRRGIIWKVG